MLRCNVDCVSARSLNLCTGLTRILSVACSLVEVLAEAASGAHSLVQLKTDCVLSVNKRVEKQHHKCLLLSTSSLVTNNQDHLLS